MQGLPSRRHGQPPLMFVGSIVVISDETEPELVQEESQASILITNKNRYMLNAEVGLPSIEAKTRPV